MKNIWVKTSFFYLSVWLAMSNILCTAHGQSCKIDLVDYENQFWRVESFLPSPVTIDEIAIESDIDDVDILPTLSLNSQSTIGSHDLKKSLFYLAQKNKFSTITFCLKERNQKQILDIHLESYWTLNRLKIHGFLIGKEMYARQYCIKPGDRFDRAKHEYSLEVIKMSLKEQGYFNALVTGQCMYNALNKTVTVFLNIDKKNPFTIRNFQCSCNHDYLIPIICDEFKQLKKTRYHASSMQKCIARIKSELCTRGYSLQSFDIQEVADYNRHSVDISADFVVSNKRCFLFCGNSYFSNEALQNQLLLFESAARSLPPNILCEELKKLYQQHNFHDVSVCATQEDDCCYFTIKEGAQKVNQTIKSPVIESQLDYEPKRFGKTILQNGSKLPSHLVLRELAYQTGQEYDDQSIKKSLHRLESLNIFERVQLTPVYSDLCNDQTMLLKVHEDEPYEISLRSGISLQQMSKDFIFKGVTYSAGGYFLAKNPFNYADQFRIDAEYTYGEQTLSATYIYPWIGNTPVTASLQGYHTQYLQPGLRHNHANIYSFIQQGFLAGFNYERDSFWNAQFNIGIEWMETKIVNPKNQFFVNKEITRALNFEPLLNDKKIPYLLGEPSIVIDRLDDKLNPCQGSLTVVTVKSMIPLSMQIKNSFFTKIYAEHSYFRPLYNAILALRIRAGHIFMHDFKNVMPAERFYLGGANSIRSYETDMCPPLGILKKTDGKECFVPQGGKSLVNLNAEIRLPISKRLQAVLFQDLGALSNNHFADIIANGVLAGTGFGIRYNTPIGPLRFDFALKWNRPDDRIARYAWFLSFGNAF